MSISHVQTFSIERTAVDHVFPILDEIPNTKFPIGGAADQELASDGLQRDQITRKQGQF